MIVPHKQYIQDINFFKEKLALQVNPIKVLFGIHRGGLGVALHLSYLIGDIPVYPIYREKLRKKYYYTSLVLCDPGDIIIDDVVETTQTFREIKRDFPECVFASLYQKVTPENEDFLKKYPSVIIGRQVKTDKYISLPYQR